MTKERRRINELKAEMKEMEQSLDKLEKERREFRSHFARRFRWWIKLQGEQSTPSLSWLIEDDAKFLTSVDSWYW